MILQDKKKFVLNIEKCMDNQTIR